MQEEILQNIDLHGNANDYTLKTQIALTKNETVAIVTLKKCSRQIKVWLDHNRLKMNTSKTEFILLGAKQQLKKYLTKNLSVNNKILDKTSQIKYLGVYLDKTLTLIEKNKIIVNLQCVISKE